MSNEITNPYQYFPDFTRGRPIFNGKIYIGAPDTDPTIGGNQLVVLARQEDGTEIGISQPIRTGAGGIPSLNGSPVTLLIAELEFSVRIDNAQDVQQYEQARVVAPDNLLRSDLASTDSEKGFSLVAITKTAAEIAAGATIVVAHLRENRPRRYGATHDNVTDDAVAMQDAFDVAAQNRNSVYMDEEGATSTLVGTTLTIGNDFSLIGAAQAITAMTRIYTNANQPILKRSSGYQSRTILRDIMFHGQKDGVYSSTANSNTSPLVELAEGGAVFELYSVTFIRGEIGLKITKNLNHLRLTNCKFEVMADKGAWLIGARHALFTGCLFEGSGWAVYAEPSLAIAGVGDVLGSTKVIIRDSYTEGGDFFLDCVAPEVTGCFLYDTTIEIGKSAVAPVIRDNALYFNCFLAAAPKFVQDIEFYGVNAENRRDFQGFKIPALPTESDIIADYLAGDGLDYFVATQLKPTSTLTLQTGVTIDFKVDAGTISDDVVTLNVSSQNTDSLGSGRIDLAPISYGVLENTGAAMSVAIAGAAGDTVEKTVFLQSLMKNGSLTAGATTNWFAGGVPTITNDGTYTRIQGATGADALSYNKLLHLPEGTECVCLMARMKAGSTGTFSPTDARCVIIPDYFDNNDATFDDLWVYYFAADASTPIVKAKFAFYKRSPATAFDAFVKWAAIIPLRSTPGRPSYTGTWIFDPASLAADAAATTTIMADSSTTNDLKLANVADHVRIIPPYDLQGIIATAYVSATGQISVKLHNPTTGAIDLASGVWRWELTKQ